MCAKTLHELVDARGDLAPVCEERALEPVAHRDAALQTDIAQTVGASHLLTETIAAKHDRRVGRPAHKQIFVAISGIIAKTVFGEIERRRFARRVADEVPVNPLQPFGLGDVVRVLADQKINHRRVGRVGREGLALPIAVAVEVRIDGDERHVLAGTALARAFVEDVVRRDRERDAVHGDGDRIDARRGRWPLFEERCRGRRQIEQQHHRR